MLAHMGNLPDNGSDWFPLARRLAREGYLVLADNRRAVCTGERQDSDLHGTDMLDHRQAAAAPLTALIVRFLRGAMPPGGRRSAR